MIKAFPAFALHSLVKDETVENDIADIFMETAKEILETEVLHVPSTLEERVDAIEKRLEQKRATTFPVDLFARKAFSGWTRPSDKDWKTLDDYITEKNGVQVEVRRLTTLFEAILALPQVDGADAPLDCPVCETEKALTPTRIEVIRTSVASNETFSKAERDALSVLRSMRSTVSTLEQGFSSVTPKFIRDGSGLRRQAGFTVTRMTELFGNEADALIEPWLVSLRALLRAAHSVQACADAAKSAFADLVSKPAQS